MARNEKRKRFKAKIWENKPFSGLGLGKINSVTHTRLVNRKKKEKEHESFGQCSENVILSPSAGQRAHGDAAERVTYSTCIMRNSILI